MIGRFIVAAVAVFTFAIPAAAQQLECGTSEERTEREMKRAETLRERASRRARIRGEADAVSIVEAKDGIFVVQSNDTNAPFNKPFDLAGRTLRWKPTERGTWTVENIPLEWDETPAQQFGTTAGTGARFLLPNPFPFAGTQLKEVWIGRSAQLSGGVLPAPGFSVARSITGHELAAIKGPFISALGARPRSNEPTAYGIAGKDGASVISWIHSTFEAQIKLRADGSMDFNYRRAADEVYGGIAVVTGQEPWRNDVITSEATDEANTAVSGWLDAEKITMKRYPQAGLIELRATLRTALNVSQLPESGLMYDFEFANGVDDVAVLFRRNQEHEVYAPAWGWGKTEHEVVIDGRDIVLTIDENLLTVQGTNVPLKLYVATIGQQTPNDVVSTTVSLGTAPRALTTDFSTLTGTHEVTGAAVESFTLPPLSLPVIWQQMKEAHKLRDTDVDGLAVFQDFATDIVFTATAYALAGNPGVSNIHSTRSNMGPQYPRTPSLLHMNRLAIYSSEKIGTRLLLHEFGHRWLQSLNLKEGTTTSRVLNPSTNHPAQYVYTPVAFPVYGGDEASVMGGGNFRVNAAGAFTSTGEQGYGYSWLDLYLMGLAQSSEVPPFYYIANSSPALGSAYNPPAGLWYGTKKDVAIEQILEPMGARTPPYPATQRSFRVLFVLVTNGAASADEVAKLHELRKKMEEKFKVATGGRAQLSTEWLVGGPRRRSAGR